MTNFKPTPEELMDYFFDESLSKDKCQAIEDYLDQNPNEAQTWLEYKSLAQAFQKMAPEPAPIVLKNILEAAQKQAKPSFVFLDLFKFKFQNSVWIFSFGFFFIAFLSYGVTRHYYFKNPQPSLSTSKPALDLRGLASTLNTNVLTPPTDFNPQLENECKTKLEQALKLYENKNYAEANRLFSDIQTLHPTFSENQTLYLYWIQSLQNLEQYDQATTLQKQWDALRK